MPSLVLPPGVLAMAERGPSWAAYVEGLPRLHRDLVEEWGLVADGEPTHGSGSLVVPVRRDGECVVLKLSHPGPDDEHEALVLQRWGGVGAVRLLRADPHRRALLLERLHLTDLTSLWDVEACEVVAGLYPLLHRPAPPQLRRVADHVAAYAGDLAGLPRSAPLPHRLVQQAVALLADLVADTDEPEVTLHGDLHDKHVLAADREPWLAIAPSALAGDRHYEVAPVLRHRWDEVVASGDVREAVRRRFLTVVDAAGLDEDRARDWVVVRMVLDALRALRADPGRPDHDRLTTCVSVAKAVQE